MFVPLVKGGSEPLSPSLSNLISAISNSTSGSNGTLQQSLVQNPCNIPGTIGSHSAELNTPKIQGRMFVCMNGPPDGLGKRLARERRKHPPISGFAFGVKGFHCVEKAACGMGDGDRSISKSVLLCEAARLKPTGHQQKIGTCGDLMGEGIGELNQ